MRCSSLLFLAVTISIGFCQNATDFGCPRDAFSYGDQCYKIETKESGTFDDAVDVCEEIYGNVVSIHSESENGLLAREAGSRFGIDAPVGIGLRRNYATDNYTWNDNTPLDYVRKVYSSMNQEDCVVTDIFGEWWNADCNKFERFICKYKGVGKERLCPDINIVYRNIGNLTSPAYPKKYDWILDASCLYKLQVRPTDYIFIELKELELGKHDSIVVFKGWSETTSVATFVKGDVGKNVTVASHQALVKFTGLGTGIWSIGYSGSED